MGPFEGYHRYMVLPQDLQHLSQTVVKVHVPAGILEIEETEPPPHPVRDRGIGREGL
jgi:hypothetical protein